MVPAVMMEQQQQLGSTRSSIGNSPTSSSPEVDQVQPQARRLSLSLDAPASASPFPSPSSSFLPPPTPGAHEFAMKPPPAVLGARKASANAYLLGLGIALSNGATGNINAGGGSGSSPSAMPPSSPLVNGNGITTGRSRSSSRAGVLQKASFPNGTASGHHSIPETATASQQAPPFTVPFTTSPTSTSTGATAANAATDNTTHSHVQVTAPGIGASSISTNGGAPETSLLSMSSVITKPTTSSTSLTPSSSETLSTTIKTSSQFAEPLSDDVSSVESRAGDKNKNNKDVGDVLGQGPFGNGLEDRGAGAAGVFGVEGEGRWGDKSKAEDGRAGLENGGGNQSEMGNSNSSPTAPPVSATTPASASPLAGARQQQHQKALSASSKRMSIPPPSSFPLALVSLASSSTVTAPGAVSATTTSANPTTPLATTPGSRSRPPSSYFSQDLINSQLNSSRPAPPSPALSATTSIKASRRISTTSQRSRPGSGVFSSSGGLSRANSLSLRDPGGAASASAKRLSGFGFALPPSAMSSPLSSPTSVRFFSSAGLQPPQPPPSSAGSVVSSASTVVPWHREDGEEDGGDEEGGDGQDDGDEESGDGGLGSSVITLGQSAILPTSATTKPNRDSAATATMNNIDTEDLSLGQAKRATRTMYIKIRDYGFPEGDERFAGMGVDCPKVNRVGRLNRRLRGGRFGYDPSEKRTNGRTFSQGSWSTTSSASDDGDDDDDEEEEDDDEWGGMGGGGGWFRTGLGQLNWGNAATSSTTSSNKKQSGNDVYSNHGQGRPSQSDLDRNFLDPDFGEGGEEEVGEGEDDPQVVTYHADEMQDNEDADDHDDDDADEPLFPGIYRALFAFVPEGTAEVRLVEDQLVRVVKRGGGVGWAVVEVGWRASRELIKELKENGFLAQEEYAYDEAVGGEEEGGGVMVESVDGERARQGLVPESYLEPVRTDGWVDAAANP